MSTGWSPFVSSKLSRSSNASIVNLVKPIPTSATTMRETNIVWAAAGASRGQRGSERVAAAPRRGAWDGYTAGRAAFWAGIAAETPKNASP